MDTDWISKFYMFKEARIKLTAWYLVIIMAISLSFSVAIYAGINRELTRLDNFQRSKQQREDTISNLLIQRGFPVPPENQPFDLEGVGAARARIIWALGFINLSILVVAGVGGYLLAGLTLDPISKMVKDQKTFIGNASHELRTPLTSLKTEIEVALRDKKMTLSEAKDLLKSNLEDVNGMQKLSNYLLELNRYENSDSDIKMEKVNLGECTLNAIKNADLFSKENNIKIVKKISPVLVRGDNEAITEIAAILIDNAIKYSGDAKKIEITVNKDGLLIVRDYGLGIDEKDILHIFERFYRADSSRSKTKIDGYGLGLSIAGSIANHMGAKIKVQSKVGKGSTFSIQFAQ